MATPTTAPRAFRLFTLGALFLASCPHPAAPSAPEPAPRAQGDALVKACDGRDGWSDAAPPARVFGDTYYVGTCGITVLLVTSPQGHVLIDAATAEAAPSILTNIRTLGFDPRDVKLLVGSHEHIDHMGGFAALKEATGAPLAVREPARAILSTGRTDPADPQSGVIPDMTPVVVDRTLVDGETVQVGELALTVVATPGHTAGGTSWTWRACEGPQCVTIAYVDSMTAVSADSYRFTDHPERVAPFRSTFDRVSSLPCDVLITPHPGFSNLFERLSGAAPLLDPDACRRLAGEMRVRLDDRLAQESTP